MSASLLNDLGVLIPSVGLAERIKEAMGSMSAAEIARATQKTPGAVTQWLDGTTKSLRAETAALLEAATGYRASWIVTGKGPKMATSEHMVAEPEPAYLGPERRRAPNIPSVPIVGSAKLGDLGHFCPLEYPVGHGDGRIEWPSRDANAYALRCHGESMKPRIRHGEFVVVEPNHTVTPGDEVLVRSKDDRVMVKQLAYVRDGMVYLDSVNESHPRISIQQDQIVAFHYVAGIAKSALLRSE